MYYCNLNEMSFQLKKLLVQLIKGVLKVNAKKGNIK